MRKYTRCIHPIYKTTEWHTIAKHKQQHESTQTHTRTPTPAPAQGTANGASPIRPCTTPTSHSPPPHPHQHPVECKLNARSLANSRSKRSQGTRCNRKARHVDSESEWHLLVYGNRAVQQESKLHSTCFLGSSSQAPRYSQDTNMCKPISRVT